MKFFCLGMPVSHRLWGPGVVRRELSWTHGWVTVHIGEVFVLTQVSDLIYETEPEEWL